MLLFTPPSNNRNGYGASSSPCNVVWHEIRHGGKFWRLSGRAFYGLQFAVLVDDALQYPSKPCNRGLFEGRTGDAGASPSSFSRWVIELLPDRKQLQLRRYSFDYIVVVAFRFCGEPGIALSSFQFPGSPAAIINRNKVPVMCDGILFRRYNVARIRDFALEWRSRRVWSRKRRRNGLLQYGVAISGCGCRARTFLPYERVHKVPARIGRGRLQTRGTSFLNYWKTRSARSIPSSLLHRFGNKYRVIGEITVMSIVWKWNL